MIGVSSHQVMINCLRLDRGNWQENCLHGWTRADRNNGGLGLDNPFLLAMAPQSSEQANLGVYAVGVYNKELELLARVNVIAGDPPKMQLVAPDGEYQGQCDGNPGARESITNLIATLNSTGPWGRQPLGDGWWRIPTQQLAVDLGFGEPGQVPPQLDRTALIKAAWQAQKPGRCGATLGWDVRPRGKSSVGTGR